MSLNRFLVLLGGCLLTVSGAWADDVGFIDCANHSEDTQVFAKARKSPEVVSTLPCGERFTILIYGFVFSRIQTRDGNVGYVYSNIISVDRVAVAVQRSASPQISDAGMKIKIPREPVERPASAATVRTQAAPPQPAAVPAPAPVAEPPSNTPVSAAAQPATSTLVQPQVAPSQPAPAPVSTSNLPQPAEIVLNSSPTPAAQPDPSPASPASAPAPASVAPSAAAPTPEPPAAAAPPERTAPAPQPAAPSIRPADARKSWESPNPGVRTAPLIELFGGFAFSRMAGGAGTTTNMLGALGSFGYNFKSWLQLVGDSSYNYQTVNGTKNILYGNHYGPRYFYRSHNRWGLTPFAEALFGASRSDTTTSGVGGYTTSINGFSMKFGGGIDIHPNHHIDIRLFDADFYRTSFGTGLHQTNYWVSTGIVLRLFNGGNAR